MKNRGRRCAPAVFAVTAASLAGIASARAEDKPIPPGWTCDVRKVLQADSTRKPKVGLPPGRR